MGHMSREQSEVGSMSGPRILYASSALGLGHLSKDLAIADEIRSLLPDAELLWLTGPPSSRALARAGEFVLPEAERWLGGTVIAERTARGGRLDLVRYAYRSLPSWSRNVSIVRHAIERYGVDLVVGDETWELFIPINLRVLHLRVPFVMIVDFVGVESLGGSVADVFGAYVLNRIWSLDAPAFKRAGYAEIFIGDPEDIPDEPFGWRLPNRRQHALDNYTTVGHVVRFHPLDYQDAKAVRTRLGYDDRPLVICSVGGTSLGEELLRLCSRAAAPLRARMHDARVVLVCGPRISVDSIPRAEGVEVRGYVPNLFEHHACCDAAVTQCGASTTTELAALGTPFVYFPVAGHFEQELVAARLARLGVGKRMSLADTTPESLADALIAESMRRAQYTRLPAEGAGNTARHIVSML